MSEDGNHQVRRFDYSSELAGALFTWLVFAYRGLEYVSD